MQVSKWGNSLAVRLPKTLINKLGLEAGDELTVVAASPKKIVVEKADPRADFLKQMQQFHWPASARYRFDRDEANER